MDNIHTKSTTSHLFKGFVQGSKRRIVAEVDITLERALDFLNESPLHRVEDYTGKEFTKDSLLQQEEKEDVKNIRSPDRTGLYNVSVSGGEVPESSYRKLFGTIRNNTE